MNLLDSILRGHKPRLIAVIGPSGSGKSSIVRAGMLSKLEKGALGKSASWPRLIFKPGKEPFQILGIGLLSLPNCEKVLAKTCDVLGITRFGRDHPHSLDIAAKLAIQSHPEETRLLVVVAQFEEVFTQCTPEDRRALIDNLVYAATAPDGPVVIVLSLRADFFGECATYQALADLISGNQKLIGPMSRDELRCAIEKPATLAGCEVDPVLVEQLLNDVGSESGTLPLLEFVLTLLWNKKTGRRMTTEDYAMIKGLRGAVTQHADTVLKELSQYGNVSQHSDDLGPRPTHWASWNRYGIPGPFYGLKVICRQVFLLLIEPGKGTDDTRRRLPYSQLAKSTNWKLVVEILITERLLTASNPQDSSKGTLEIAHESLIKYWATLQDWVNAHRKSMELQSEYKTAADRWVENDRHLDYLIRDLQLENALKWTKEFPDDFANLSVVKEFIDASEAAQQQRSQDELRKLTRSRRKLIAVAVVATLFAIVSGVMGLWADAKRRSANVATAIAESRRLAALSDSFRPERLDLAMLLALESTRKDTFESKAAIQRVFNTRPEVSHFLDVSEGMVTSLAYGPDGRIAVGYGGGITSGVVVFDARGCREGHSRLEVNEGSVTTVAFGPDGRIVAGYRSRFGIGAVVFGTQGERVSHGPLKLKGDTVTSLIVDDDGRIAAGYMNKVGGDRGVMVFDARGERLTEALLKESEQSVTSLAFAPDGRIAAGYDDGVTVFNARGHRESNPRLEVKEGSVTTVAFGPDGQIAAGYETDSGGGIIVFGASGEKLNPAPLLIKEGNIIKISYNKKGDIVVGYNNLEKGGFQGGIVVFGAQGERMDSARLEVNEGSVTSLAHGPDGQIAAGYFALAKGGFRGGVVVFGGRSERVVSAPLEVEGHVSSVAYGPDGQIVAGHGLFNFYMNTGAMILPSGLVVFGAQGKQVSPSLLKVKENSVTSVAFGPNGKIAAGFGRLTRDITEKRNRIDIIRMGNDRQSEGGVVVFGAQGERTDYSPLEVHEGYVTSVAFGSDGRIVAGYHGNNFSGRSDGVVIFDALGKRAFPASLEVKEGSVTSVAIGPNGRIAVGYGDVVDSRTTVGGVVVFDVSGQRMNPAPMEVKEGYVTSVAFGPDGRIAAGYQFGVLGGLGGVVVFDAQGERADPAVLEVKEGSVTSVAFSPEGRIAAGYQDNVVGQGLTGGVVIFDVRGERASPAPLEVKRGSVTSVAFGPEGRIAAGFDAGKENRWASGVVVFDCDPDSWRRKVEQAVNRNFTRAEWSQFFPTSSYRRTIRTCPWPDDLPLSNRKESEALEEADLGL